VLRLVDAVLGDLAVLSAMYVARRRADEAVICAWSHETALFRGLWVGRRAGEHLGEVDATDHRAGSDRLGHRLCGWLVVYERHRCRGIQHRRRGFAAGSLSAATRARAGRGRPVLGLGLTAPLDEQLVDEPALGCCVE
jgi:hypothetical protein